MKTIILFFTNFLTNNSQMYRDWVSEKRQKTTLIEMKNQLSIFQEKINSIKKVQKEALGKNEEFDKLLEELIDRLGELYKIHFSNYEFLLSKSVKPVKYTVKPVKYTNPDCIWEINIKENIKKIREYEEWKLKNPNKTYIQDDFINECYNVKPEDLK